jgi:hypothetical protein
VTPSPRRVTGRVREWGIRAQKEGDVSCDRLDGLGDAASNPRTSPMPRYVNERTFADGLHVPLTDAGVRLVGQVNKKNAELGCVLLDPFFYRP